MARRVLLVAMVQVVGGECDMSQVNEGRPSKILQPRVDLFLTSFITRLGLFADFSSLLTGGGGGSSRSGCGRIRMIGRK